MIEKLLFFMGDMEANFPGKDRLSKLIKKEDEMEELSLDDLYGVAAAGQIPRFVPDEKKEK